MGRYGPKTAIRTFRFYTGPFYFFGRHEVSEVSDAFSLLNRRAVGGVTHRKTTAISEQIDHESDLSSTSQTFQQLADL